MAGLADGDAEPGAPFNAIIKYDHERGATMRHDFGAGQVAGEPIFVPRAPDAGEDDGWLLSLVYRRPSTGRGSSSWTRATSSRGRVAHLRHHVPLGFHGTFTDRVAQP